MSKFPRTITTASDARAQLQAMTCASESISSMAEKELLSDEVEADTFFVIVPATALISRNVTLKDCTRNSGDVYLQLLGNKTNRCYKSYKCNCVGFSVETKILYY